MRCIHILNDGVWVADSIKPALIMWPAECYDKIKTSVTFYEGHSHSADCLDMIQSHLIHTWYRNARLLSRPELPYFSLAKMRLPNHTTSSCGIHIIYDMSSVREMVLLLVFSYLSTYDAVVSTADTKGALLGIAVWSFTVTQLHTRKPKPTLITQTFYIFNVLSRFSELSAHFFVWWDDT